MKVEYLGPNRSIVHRGPSGEEYLFFVEQQVEVTNEEDIEHYKNVGGFAVGNKEVKEAKIARESKPETNAKEELKKKSKQ